MNPRELTSGERAVFALVLEELFPWLATDDEASGADTIQDLCELYSTLTEEIA